MISKHLGRPAQRLEALGDVELGLGHRELALELFFEAAVKFAQAQHPIFQTNDEKRFLHGSSIRCFDKVRQLAPTVIEHVDIPWQDTVVSGNLHLAPVEDRAPLVFFIPGCDRTKKSSRIPLRNWANQRGLHLFVFDGPGQGESNIRDIPLTVDNYEDAASTALTYLLGRTEIDRGPDSRLLQELRAGRISGARASRRPITAWRPASCSRRRSSTKPINSAGPSRRATSSFSST